MTASGKTFLVTALLAAFCAAGLYGCPPEQGGSAIKAGQAAGLNEELARLDVRYEVLLKDDPPQAETLSFRKMTADADKALDKGRLDQAGELIEGAREWMDEARPRYYEQHRSRILSGEDGESPEALLEEARFFLEKAGTRKKRGGTWAADIYYDAAIEQGELALLAVKNTPEHSLKLIEMAREVEAVYTEAGDPEGARLSRERVIKSLKVSIDVLGQRITDRIAGRAQGYDSESLEDPEKLDKAARELMELNDLRNAIIDQAGRFAPGKIEARDYTPAVAGWVNRQRNRRMRPRREEKKEEPPKHDRRDIIRRELKEHNEKYRQGAESLQGTGISLRQTDIYQQGATLIIRGELQNFRTMPIMNPKVTVVGYVYSEVIDLKYSSFPPLMRTSFHIPILGFNADALKEQGIIPPHELVLIFEEPNGVTRKVITATIK